MLILVGGTVGIVVVEMEDRVYEREDETGWVREGGLSGWRRGLVVWFRNRTFPILILAAY